MAVTAAPHLDPHFHSGAMRIFPSTLSASAFHAYREERRPLWMLLSGMCFPGCLWFGFPKESSCQARTSPMGSQHSTGGATGLRVGMGHQV